MAMIRPIPLQKETLRTSRRCELVEITSRVAEAVRRHRVVEGQVIVYVPHTTAGVTINENADPDVKHDLLRKLEELIPENESYYRHAEGNSDSHLKASMMGSSATILIEAGHLVLGRWQGIYFCEFDGPRDRQVYIKITAHDPE